MTAHSANLSSIDAVRSLRTALQQFAAEATSALTHLQIEARRPVEWIEHDRTLYWPREVQKASDAVSEARIALQRCELTIDANDRRSCYDERKTLEKAKRRLLLAEEKVRLVRKWRLQISKEVEQFEVQAAQLQRYLDSDLLRATTVLSRMAESLDAYVGMSAPAFNSDDQPLPPSSSSERPSTQSSDQEAQA